MDKIKILVKKELLDILRDKKTLIMMVVVPIILYPAIIIGMVFVMNFIMQDQMEKEHIVAYDIQDEAYITPLKSIYEESKEEYNLKVSFKAFSDDKKNDSTDLYDTWVSFKETNTGLSVTAEYASTNQDSSYAESIVEDIVDVYCENLLEEKLAQEGLSQEFLTPVTYEAKDSATEAESFGMNMGGSIGMLLIVTIMLGAFYPAIDATTGEKERGTLETLLTLPVTNFQMIMSKFISVSVFSCVTAVLSLLSLGASIVFLINSVTAEASEEFTGIDLTLFLKWLPILMIVMIVTALLITAFCMCFCIFAKSFKEANNYITPVMLIVMFASMIAMVPSITLNFKTALIPIVNVSLLMKQVISQQLNPALTGITIAVNLCYSILIVFILSKMYDSENILFTDGFQSFRIFQKRSEIKKGSVPKLGDLFLSIVVLLLLTIYASLALSAKSVFAGVISTQLIILFIPLIVTFYIKSDLKQLFSLKAPVLKWIFKGLFLYIGTYSIMLIISLLLTNLFPESAQNVEMSFEALIKQPFIFIVLVMAIMPGIGEELFFRGFLFGSLKHRYSIGIAIIISSLIFGAFHMSLVKIIPTAILGACFAYITWRSGSIYIGMGLHFLNNLMSVIAMKYPDIIEQYVPILAKSEFSATDIVILLMIGVVGIIIGSDILTKIRKIS